MLFSYQYDCKRHRSRSRSRRNTNTCTYTDSSVTHIQTLESQRRGEGERGLGIDNQVEIDQKQAQIQNQRQIQIQMQNPRPMSGASDPQVPHTETQSNHKAQDNLDWHVPPPSLEEYSDMLEIMSKMTVIVCVSVLTTYIIGVPLLSIYPAVSFIVDSVINSYSVALMHSAMDYYYLKICSSCHCVVKRICILCVKINAKKHDLNGDDNGNGNGNNNTYTITNIRPKTTKTQTKTKTKTNTNTKIPQARQSRLHSRLQSRSLPSSVHDTNATNVIKTKSKTEKIDDSKNSSSSSSLNDNLNKVCTPNVNHKNKNVIHNKHPTDTNVVTQSRHSNYESNHESTLAPKSNSNINASDYNQKKIYRIKSTKSTKSMTMAAQRQNRQILSQTTIGRVVRSQIDGNNDTDGEIDVQSSDFDESEIDPTPMSLAQRIQSARAQEKLQFVSADSSECLA